MTSRTRQSTAGPSTAVGVQMPPYEPPEYPLNDSGQRVLHNLLAQNHNNRLKQHLEQAITNLSDSAALINERVTVRTDRDRKRKLKREQNGMAATDDDERREQQLDEFQERVTSTTKHMEEAIRKMIDGQEMAAWLQKSVSDTKQQAQHNAIAASQRVEAQTQQTQRGRRDDDDEDEDEEMTDYDPTLPGQTQRSTQRVPVVVPSRLFRERLQREKDRYQSLSHTTRYSGQKDYITFKRSVHDASYPAETAPPLPPQETWFTTSGAPAPGIVRGSTAAGGDDSDDDIAIASEKISTRCPLTLQEFREPVMSRKCPHLFEKSAIMDLMRQSNIFTGNSTRRGARDGLRTVQCPVGGCDQMLTKSDLHPDAAFIRKIRRIQKQREALAGESDDDDDNIDDSRMPESIHSDDGDGYEDVDAASSRVVPKMERASGVSREGGGGGGGGMSYDGAMDDDNIVDLGSGSDDDE